MKIAYLIGEDIDFHPGLKGKISHQVREWVAHGHQVNVIVSRARRTESAIDFLSGTNVKQRTPSTPIGRLQRLGMIREHYSFAARALNKLRPELTYSRYLFPVPHMRSILKNAGKLAIEINSNDRSEMFLRHVTSGIYNLLFRSRLLNRADGFVFVTDELASDPAFHFSDTPKTVIGNGVDTGRIPFLERPRNTRPQLCFIGSPNQAWQGFDKLATLAHLLPQCDIHVIGPTQDACLALWGDAPKNIQVHGYLDAVAMAERMPMFDIGISTLALHRKQMDEACPLKIRQYLAYGMPAITAYRDPDVPDTAPFVLRLPNTEDNIAASATEIQRFIEFAFGNEDLRRQARTHAEKQLDHARKEAQRQQFFEQLVGRAR